MKTEPHAWNTSFEWSSAETRLHRLTESERRQYNEQGYLVLENAFSEDEIDDIVPEIDEFEKQMEAFLRTQKDGRLFIARADEITFTAHLVARSRRLRSFCSGPVFQDLCHDLIGPDVRLYWDQAVYKKPGTEVPFPWHQDNGYTYIEPQQYLTCWVALSNATVENGCPWVVPGIHRAGTLKHELSDLGFVCFEDSRPRGAIPAPVGKGGIVLFSSLTPHATGSNRTESVRKAYIVQFAPDGACTLKQNEDGEFERTTVDKEDTQFRILSNGRAA